MPLRVEFCMLSKPSGFWVRGDRESVMQPAFYDDVHQFWFGHLPDFNSFNEDRFSLWFGGTRDGEIVERFATALSRAESDVVDVAALTPSQQVGLVILLDQFPRSIFRGLAKSYAYDERARAAVHIATTEGMRPFKLLERAFLTICLAHSEHLSDQECASRHFRDDIGPFAPPDNRFYEGGRIQTAKYLDIIRNFGRFPHRNPILGRETTAEEAQFLSVNKMPPF